MCVQMNTVPRLGNVQTFSGNNPLNPSVNCSLCMEIFLRLILA